MKLKIHAPAAFSRTSDGRWRLEPASRTREDPREIPLRGSPFLVGRSADCDLILPEGEQLRASTSRWHCHFRKDGDHWYVADGGAAPHPDTGRPKPSISGTRLNGSPITRAVRVRGGELIEIGPWRIGVGGETDPVAPANMAMDILKDVARGEARTLSSGDPRLSAQFGNLHEFVQKLARIPDIERSLEKLLSYAAGSVAAAEVAAVLIGDPSNGFHVRAAWEQGRGAIADFPFSQSLLRSLPPDRSFFLQAKLKSPSESQSIHDISSGLLLPLWGKGARLGVFYLDNRRNGKSFTEEDLYFCSALGSLVSLQLSLEQQARVARIEENMSRYFAPDVVERIIEHSRNDDPVGLDVREADVTVLFSDLEDFTSYARGREPREVVEALNPYLETVARVIQQEGGHVNKFIGDAVMGIFGAQPGESFADPAEHARQAVRAALRVPQAWRAEARKRGVEHLRVRLGVNSGRAVVGNIGYPARLEYSVLGDVVNLAARLEKLAEPDRSVVGERTRELAADAFDFEELGPREIRGIGTVPIFSPRPKDSGTV